MLSPQVGAHASRPVGRVRRFLRALGPGLITGAADDDPCAIAAYTQAGAAFGFQLLWAAPLILPFLIAVQLMCARIGVVTRRGLAGVLRSHYPRWVLWSACGLLVSANTLALAADLGGMAAAARLVTGLPPAAVLPAFAAALLALLAYGSYAWIVRVFKWLSLALFAYVAAAVLSRPEPLAVLRGSVLPHLEWSRAYLMTLVAMLGSAVSPYLYFWETSQVAEHEVHERGVDDRQGEERREGPRRGWDRRRLLPRRVSLQGRQLRLARIDVATGMVAAMLISYSIVLTAGATLHARGIRGVVTADQAATALAPLAGRAASALFALGLIGTGALGVPVLAGSAAYAIAEAASWRRGLDRRPRAAGPFYGLIAAEIVAGMALDYLGVNPVRLLFLAAVVNGVLAPPLLALVLTVANNRAIMGEHVNGRVLNVLGVLVTIVMAVAAIALLASLL